MSKEILTDQTVDLQLLNNNNLKTREKIIEHAMKLFLLHSYHGTSTEAIATSVDIKKSSLFYHFSNKEDIAISAITTLHQRVEQHLAHFLHLQKDTTGATDLLKTLLKILESSLTEQIPFGLLAQFSQQTVETIPGFATAVLDYLSLWENFIAEVLEHFYDRHQAVFLAQQTVIFIQGLIICKRIAKTFNQQLSFRTQLLTLWQLNDPQLNYE